MREILFRGKRKDNGEWEYGFFCKTYSPTNPKTRDAIMHENNPPFPAYSCAEIDVETVGQSTGLTDKNDKRIFEGDIVTGLFLFEMSVKAVVTFQDGAFGLEWHRGKAKTFNAFTSICNVEYEVIGNIHDNPELMKGETDERTD